MPVPPSQKAAPKAWGSYADLFARGVTGETTMREPLARSGRSGAGGAAGGSHRPPGARRNPAHLRPLPTNAKTARSHAGLDGTARRLSDLMGKHQAPDEDPRWREWLIARERRALDRRQERERGAAERLIDKEREAHVAALSRAHGSLTRLAACSDWLRGHLRHRRRLGRSRKRKRPDQTPALPLWRVIGLENMESFEFATSSRVVSKPWSGSPARP